MKTAHEIYQEIKRSTVDLETLTDLEEIKKHTANIRALAWVLS